MLVRVDEQTFETTLKPENTVRELVESVRADLSGTDRLLLGIRVDGEEISGEDYVATLDRTLASFRLLDFVTGDPRRVVGEALSECLNLLAKTDERRRAAITLFTQGESQKGMIALGECCRSWHQVHEAIRNALELLRLDPDGLSVNGTALSVVLNGTKDQFNQMRAALEVRDFVLVSDLLQYEFDPIVENWRAVIRAILDRHPYPAPDHSNKMRTR